MISALVNDEKPEMPKAFLELFVYEGCCSRRVMGNPRRASALRISVELTCVQVRAFGQQASVHY